MAHYAFLDGNNIVTHVIVGKEEGEDGINWEEYYGEFQKQKCKRTSYNTYAGEHKLGGTPFRKNYATIGGMYDEFRDAFIPARVFNSWTLNETTCQWEPPIPYPTGDGNYYTWDESILNWKQQET